MAARNNNSNQHNVLLLALLLAISLAATATVDSSTGVAGAVLLENEVKLEHHVVGDENSDEEEEEEEVYEGDWDGDEEEEDEEEGEWGEEEEEDGDWEDGDVEEEGAGWDEEEEDGEHWEGEEEDGEWDEEEGEWDEEDYDEEEEVEGNGWMPEEERLVEYNKRNYTWPLPNYVPDTPGWKRLMDERFRQVARLPDKDARYEGYVQTINAAYMVPNFTEHGFGLTRAPADLAADLRQAIRDGLPTADYEEPINEIDAPLKPLFIQRPDLTARVLRELQPYVEAWSGIELTPFRAYGFRLYQNQSQLTMHVDRMQTHIVSCILHIDSSEDSDPWPLFIEDLHGRTHEVLLTSGDLLFYESSKCFHGRPQRFNGSWYSSIFVHYYPANVGWQDTDHSMEAHYAVPPVWQNEPQPHPSDDGDDVRLEMVGGGMRHPDCPNAWCPSTQNTVQWGGPGKDGYWIDPAGVRHEFHPQPPAGPRGSSSDGGGEHEEL